MFGVLLSVFWGLGEVIQQQGVFAALRDESALSHSCYSFPDKDFALDNNVAAKYGSSPHVMLEVGASAINFSLKDATGNKYKLSELLTEKPVLLVMGMVTCPAFRGLEDSKFPYSSHRDEYSFTEKAYKYMTVVHIVGPEPHPMWPHNNFDIGTQRMNYWSTIPCALPSLVSPPFLTESSHPYSIADAPLLYRQPRTYQERLDMSISGVQKLLHSKVPSQRNTFVSGPF